MISIVFAQCNRSFVLKIVVMNKWFEEFRHDTNHSVSVTVMSRSLLPLCFCFHLSFTSDKSIAGKNAIPLFLIHTIDSQHLILPPIGQLQNLHNKFNDYVSLVEYRTILSDVARCCGCPLNVSCGLAMMHLIRVVPDMPLISTVSLNSVFMGVHC